MVTYKYSLITKIIYRYGNIPITFLLLIYLVESIIQVRYHWYITFFFIINVAILVSLNKYFIKTYRFFPFQIIADNQKMICSKFFLNKKQIEIKYSDIKKIEGGILSDRLTKPIYLLDVNGKILLGFYSHTGVFSKLLETIIKNVNEDLYQQLLTRMKKIN